MCRLFKFLFFSCPFLMIHSQDLSILSFYDANSKKFGLKNSEDTQLISPQWNSLQKINVYFYYGEKSDSLQYIYRYDKSTNQLIRINYLLPDSNLYDKHLVIIQSFPGGPKGVMDIDGKEILPTFYNNIWIKENYILSELDNKITIYNLEGKKVLPKTFKYVDIKNGFIYVKIEDDRFANNEKYIVYNNNLKPITEDDWTIIGQFGKDHLMLIQTLNNQLFYINESGQIRIKPNMRLNYEDPFSNGYARVSSKKTPKKYGFIDTSGKIIIPLEYDNAGPFQTKYAFIEKQENGKLMQGLIDSKNKIIKIFPVLVINRSKYYDSNEATYYLSNMETYDANGNYKEDKNLIK